MSDPLTAVLATFRSPETTGWQDAWVGIEPTFQSKKSIAKWHAMAAEEGGEDAYFKSDYMLGTQKKVAKGIAKKWRDLDASARIFDSVEVEKDLDQWKVERRNIVFRWPDPKLRPFTVRWTLDPETFEYSVKPVPLAWFYDDRFVRFLQSLLYDVPQEHGLSVSIAHGGAQFSLSAKTYMGGSLLADDIATKLNHPELSTFVMDYPNPDDRPFRATRERAAAFTRVLDEYWAGAYHPRALGTPTALQCYLDRGFEPCPAPPAGLVDPMKGPVGSPREVFQNNFVFGRAVRLRAQNVHPGYWQAQHPHEDGYRPDQIMRYGEGNLNRLQIAGELHVKSGLVLDVERAPEADAPLELAHLYTEASWENRGQMSKTSARDFAEAVLLDAHHARWLQHHPHVTVKASLLQDQLLADADVTLRRYAPEVLGRLESEARAGNLESSHGRLKSSFVEPEVVFWYAWAALPPGEKAAVAREVVAGFIERVEQAASVDPRPGARTGDPMEWHRHRIHPVVRDALPTSHEDFSPGDPVRKDMEAYLAKKDEYLARRPVYSQLGGETPWEEAAKALSSR